MVQNISFNSSNTHSSINPTHSNFFNTRSSYLTVTKPDYLTFKGQINYVLFDKLIQKILGVLSKEDVIKIHQNVEYFIKKYRGMDTNSLIDINKKNIEEMISLLEKYGIKSLKTEQGITFSDNISSLDKAKREKIKKLYMKTIIMRETFIDIKQPDPLFNNPSFNDWFENINYRNKIPNTFNSLYVHPVDKAKFFVGESISEDLKYIETQVALIKQKNLPFQDIETNKEELLNKIRIITNKSNWAEMGAFSQNEIQNLKSLAIKYEIYDRVQVDNNLFSKEVESVIANSSKKLCFAKVGDVIDDLGLVVQKTTIYDKTKKQNIPCIVILSKGKKDFCFKLFIIDNEQENAVLELVQEYAKAKKTFGNCSSNQSLELNTNANRILQAEKKLDIAKVHFNIVPLENLRGFSRDINHPERIETIINMLKSKGINKIALVVDFINSDSQRYYEGGRKVVLPLIHLLKENNCNDIFVRASAIGENKHHPLPLYLRAGFEPISYTKEEIMTITDNLRKPFDPKIPVYMYLPRNASVNEIVNKQKPLKEVFEFKN